MHFCGEVQALRNVTNATEPHENVGAAAAACVSGLRMVF